MKNVIAERVIHRGMNRISLSFPYDPELIKIVRRLPDARWSKQMKCWHIEDLSEAIPLLLDAFHGKAYIDYSSLKPKLVEKIRLKKEEEEKAKGLRLKVTGKANFPPLSDKGKEDIERYRRWMEANRYPETTTRTYTEMAATFLRFTNPKEAEDCTSDDLVRLVDDYILPAVLI